MKMFYLVWVYHVDSSKQADFEKQYSKDGPWFNLFMECDDYLGHELLKKQDGQYLIIDKWISEEFYQEFLAENKSSVDNLESTSEVLYDSRELLGEYDLLSQ